MREVREGHEEERQGEVMGARKGGVAEGKAKAMKKVADGRTAKGEKKGWKKCEKAAVRRPSPVLYSPVEVCVVGEGGRKKKISGVLLPKKTMASVVKLLDKATANGLSGRDAVLVMALKRSLLSFIA